METYYQENSYRLNYQPLLTADSSQDIMDEAIDLSLFSGCPYIMGNDIYNPFGALWDYYKKKRALAIWTKSDIKCQAARY